MFAALLLGACAGESADPDSDGDSTAAKAPATLRSQLAAGVPQDVIVLLAEQDRPAGDVDGLGQGLALDLDSMPAADARPLGDELVEARAELYAQLQERVADAVSGSDALELRVRYRNLPFMLFGVSTLVGLDLLAAQPEIAHVYPDERFEHQLAKSLPQIHQPEVQATGKLGASTSVAVLDTGCDYTRAAFGSCSAPGAAGCKVAYAADFAPNDGALDDHGHGTNVSAIVLGVAPGSKILALDVFSGGSAPGSTILQGIDWTISNRVAYEIVAMNMSLGGGSYSSPCSSDYFATALANARSAGILAAVASGNEGYTGAIASPACAPAAISVGAVYDANVGGLAYDSCTDASTAADKVACFSNSAGFLSLLAPGAPISAGGYTMTGTSQASPHVAGALAVLRSASPGEAMSETVSRLTGSGPAITDARNGLVKRRLDLQAALNAGSSDTTPPTNAVLQASAGNARVELAWSSGSDAGSGVAGYHVVFAAGASPGSCSTGTPLYTGSARSVSHTAAINGTTYGYRVCSRDVAGNLSAGTTASARPVPERNAPTGSVAIQGGAPYTKSPNVTLTLAARDEGIVASMCLSNSAGSCLSFIPYASSRAWTLSASGTVYVRWRDAWGNTSATPASDGIVIDKTAPAASTLSATAGVGQVAVSWTPATDAGSGVGGYKLVWARGTTAPATCSAGTAAYQGSLTAYSHTGLAAGKQSYRQCATDRAGNMSAGVTRTVTIK